MAQDPVPETGPTLPTSLLALQVPIRFPAKLLHQQRQQLVLHGTLFRKVDSTGMDTETRHPVVVVVLQLLAEAAMADGLMESTFLDLLICVLSVSFLVCPTTQASNRPVSTSRNMTTYQSRLQVKMSPSLPQSSRTLLWTTISSGTSSLPITRSQHQSRNTRFLLSWVAEI